MSTLIKHIKDNHYGDHILSDRQIADLLGGSDDRRYGQVKRALKAKEMVKIKRGLYVLANKHRSGPIHKFAIAQAMIPGSYISMETALAYHGWIPEAVYETISIAPGRKKYRFIHDTFGTLSFYPLAINKYEFLQKVKRLDTGTQFVLVAEPLRALMDLATYRKQEWTTLSWIENSLRIDRSSLTSLRQKDFQSLSKTYKHKRTRMFLKELQREVMALKSANRLE